MFHNLWHLPYWLSTCCISTGSNNIRRPRQVSPPASSLLSAFTSTPAPTPSGFSLLHTTHRGSLLSSSWIIHTAYSTLALPKPPSAPPIPEATAHPTYPSIASNTFNTKPHPQTKPLFHPEPKPSSNKRLLYPHTKSPPKSFPNPKFFPPDSNFLLEEAVYGSHFPSDFFQSFQWTPLAIPEPPSGGLELSFPAESGWRREASGALCCGKTVAISGFGRWWVKNGWQNKNEHNTDSRCG